LFQLQVTVTVHLQWTVHSLTHSVSLFYKGIVLHGMVLVSAIVGIFKLRRVNRFGTNVQTVAVLLMALHGVLYTTHCKHQISISHGVLTMYIVVTS
jgi:hypothetical protein